MAGVKEVDRTVALYPKTRSGAVAKFLDGAISAVAPKWGERRKNARLRGEFAQQRLTDLVDKLGASWTRPNTNRDGNWLATGYSIDALLHFDIEELQNRCAELYRTNNVAHAAVEGRVANEVGQGIKVQSRVGDSRGLPDESDSEINRALEDLFGKWSRDGVDITRSLNIFEFQRLLNRSLGIFGEAIVLLSETPSNSGITLTCELISPERLVSPPGKEYDSLIRQGVEYNENGTIKGYWIGSLHPGELASYESTLEFYPRFDARGLPRVLHVYEHLFAQQSRGVPWMAACMDQIKDLDDWREAELIAKQVEACFGLIFTGGEKSASPYEQAAANAVQGSRLEELEPGMIHYAQEGETITTIDPQRPGSTFAPFVENTLRSIAAALNFPYEILAKNFFRTTFSSGQLAMLDGRHGFKSRRQIIIDGFLIPMWGRFVDDAVFFNGAGGTIGSGYVLDRDKYTKSLWVAPGWGFINPKDEVRAASDALDADITTLGKIYAELGEDADVQLRNRHEEKMKQIQYNVEQRKYQWDLEEEMDIPHEQDADKVITPEDNNDAEYDNPPTEASEQESEEQPAT